MASIAKYYAEVGTSIDHKSLRSVQAYFKTIERTLHNFQRRVAKQQAVSLKVKVDRASLFRNLQMSVGRISKSVIIPLKRFEVSKASLTRAINSAMAMSRNTGRSGIRIGALLSQGSLVAMRAQIRSALEGVLIRPKISPSVIRGRGVTDTRGIPPRSRPALGGQFLDPRNTTRMSPWHNPMMIGGGTGAFLRYGAYSLPFVGGVMGLNALSNAATEFRAQETGLEFAASLSSDPTKDVKYYRNYLKQVGERTGVKESLLSRDFHQMLAGSAGTPMEPHLEEGFLGLTQYASILGLSDENMRLVMRGVTQMVGKGKITA